MAEQSLAIMPAEQHQVVTNCDHLSRLKYSPPLRTANPKRRIGSAGERRMGTWRLEAASRKNLRGLGHEG